ALKPRLGRIKVGHLGTLDPFASGLLPLCLGEATKVARYLLVEHKAYEGTIRLGTATDTLDRTGTPIDTAPVPALAQAALDAVAARFTGRQQQVPPMYSALKRDGVPLYELARRGRSRSSVSSWCCAQPTGSTSASPARKGRTCACWRPTSGGRSRPAPTWSACAGRASAPFASRTRRRSMRSWRSRPPPRCPCWRSARPSPAIRPSRRRRPTRSSACTAA